MQPHFYENSKLLKGIHFKQETMRNTLRIKKKFKKKDKDIPGGATLIYFYCLINTKQKAQLFM
jgi:hypothetical protein